MQNQFAFDTQGETVLLQKTKTKTKQQQSCNKSYLFVFTAPVAKRDHVVNRMVLSLMREKATCFVKRYRNMFNVVVDLAILI